jgi:hypothetical protein
MSKVFVVAGNHNEAYEYINRKIAERISNGETVNKIGDYVYLDKVNRLRGVSNPHGVFIGTWKQRPDILDIVFELIMHSTDSTRLREIHDELYKNLTEEQKRMESIKKAAIALSDEIDKEVLNNLGNNI